MQNIIRPQPMPTFPPITNAPGVTRLNRPSDAELCMRACGCYRGAGFPGGPGFIPAGVTVSGQVIGTTGTPAPGLTMDNTINGRPSTSTTDRTGRYAVTALRGSDVSVAPRTPVGVTSTPPRYNFINLQSNAPNRNFSLRGLMPTPR